MPLSPLINTVTSLCAAWRIRRYTVLARCELPTMPRSCSGSPSRCWSCSTSRSVFFSASASWPLALSSSARRVSTTCVMSSNEPATRYGLPAVSRTIDARDLDPAKLAIGADHAGGEIDLPVLEVAHRGIDGGLVIGVQAAAPGLAVRVHRRDRAAGQLGERGAHVDQRARWPRGEPERLLRALGDLAELLLAALDRGDGIASQELRGQAGRAQPQRVLGRQRRIERARAEHRDDADRRARVVAQRRTEVRVDAELAEPAVAREQLLDALGVVADASTCARSRTGCRRGRSVARPLGAPSSHAASGDQARAVERADQRVAGAERGAEEAADVREQLRAAGRRVPPRARAGRGRRAAAPVNSRRGHHEVLGARLRVAHERDRQLDPRARAVGARELVLELVRPHRRGELRADGDEIEVLGEVHRVDKREALLVVRWGDIEHLAVRAELRAAASDQRLERGVEAQELAVEGDVRERHRGGGHRRLEPLGRAAEVARDEAAQLGAVDVERGAGDLERLRRAARADVLAHRGLPEHRVGAGPAQALDERQVAHLGRQDVRDRAPDQGPRRLLVIAGHGLVRVDDPAGVVADQDAIGGAFDELERAARGEPERRVIGGTRAGDRADPATDRGGEAELVDRPAPDRAVLEGERAIRAAARDQRHHELARDTGILEVCAELLGSRIAPRVPGRDDLALVDRAHQRGCGGECGGEDRGARRRAATTPRG